MPYSSIDELPPAIKDKYSTHQQQVFVAAWNAAYDKTCKDKGPEEREACAFKIAHAAAQEGREQMHDRPDGRLTSRMLNITLADPKFVEQDGGLLLRDVRILAEGTWTDSYQQTPCHYSAQVLREYAGNWRGNGYWLRHQGGAPRSISEKVGEVRNPRYGNGAVMGDVFLHLASQESRDHAEMVRRGFANNVSAELGTQDEWDAANKRYEANYIEFSGVASVDRGACESCRIKDNEGGEPLMEEKEMDQAEFDKRLDDLKLAILAEVKAMLAKKPEDEVEEPKPEDEKPTAEFAALSEKLDGATKMLQAYEERLKVIENAPNPKTFAPEPTAAGPSAGERELDRYMEARKLPKIVGKSIICE
jgi:cation transport regulator ChaB